MDFTSMAIGFGLAFLGMIGGYFGRTWSHAILPLRDPGLIGLIVLEIIVAIAVPGMSADGPVTAMAMLDMGYITGYVICRPHDNMILDLPGSSIADSHVEPMVYYYRNGALYTMPQTLKGVIFSHMGARHPLDMPVHEISMTRSQSVTNGLLTIRSMSVVPVSVHETEDVDVGLIPFGSRKIRDANRNIIREEPRYLFHTTVTSHRIRFPDSVIADPRTFWLQEDVYREAVVNAVDAEEEAARLRIQIQTAKYDAAADLISGILSMTIDAPEAHESILQKIEDERKRLRDDGGDDDDVDA